MTSHTADSNQAGRRSTSSARSGQCDICYEAASWRIDAKRDPNGPATWRICHECKALVDRGKWDLLALRKLRAWELHEDVIGGPGDLVAMRDFCHRVRRYLTSLEPIGRTD